MRPGIKVRRILAIITVLGLPLVVGSKCAFFFNTGGGSSNKPDKDKSDQGFVVVKTGSFDEPAAAGINYESGSLQGVTGDHGEFQYEDGKTVQFSIGDIDLGAPIIGKAEVSPQDLAGSSTGKAVSAVNIQRLLYSLDADPGDEVVTIPDAVRTKAVRGNAAVSTAIEFLDFSDNAAFANAASQLVAVLTNDYSYTATLIDDNGVQAIKLRSPQIAP